MAKNTETMTPFTTRLPADLHKRLKVRCIKDGTSVQEFVAKTLARALGK